MLGWKILKIIQQGALHSTPNMLHPRRKQKVIKFIKPSLKDIRFPLIFIFIMEKVIVDLCKHVEGVLITRFCFERVKTLAQS